MTWREWLGRCLALRVQQTLLMPSACHRHPADARRRGEKSLFIPKTGDDWISVSSTEMREDVAPFSTNRRSWSGVHTSSTCTYYM